MPWLRFLANLLCTFYFFPLTPSSLSVIKWIHLNWGDAGLRSLLQKVFLELTPGGVFILEIQPISSYNKVKNLTKHIRATHEANQIHPNQIVVEAEKVGFTLLKTISPAIPHTKKGGVGFARPIHVFTKPDHTQSSAEIAK